MRTCPDCHSIVDDIAIFCDNCGFRLQSVEREIEPTIKAEIPPVSQPAAQPPVKESPAGACSACGFLNVPGEMFCQNCGVQLAPVTSVPSPPPVPIEMPQAVPPIPAGTTAESPQMNDIECSNCGYPNPAKGKFCLNCGEPLMSLARTSPEKVVEVPSVETEAAGFAVEAEVEEPVVEEPADVAEEVKPEVISSELKEELSAPAIEPEKETLQEEMPEPVPELMEAEPVPSEEEPSRALPADEEKVMDEPSPQALAGSIPFKQVLQTPEETEIRGKLVVRNSGVEIPLPAGHTELSIGRVDLVRNIFPDVDLTGYGAETNGVSRLHARIFLEGNKLFVEDLNSTNYTFVNKLRLQPGQKYLVTDGDEIRFGLLSLNYFSN